jgi:hypothetical protein
MSGKFGVVGIMDGWKKGDLPGNQMVNIVLNSYGTLNDGSLALTAQLASDQEVDYAVDQLIKDLEVARKKAKEKIKNTNERIRSSLSEK